MPDKGSHVTRRKFISASTAGLVTAGLAAMAPSCSKSEKEPLAKLGPPENMIRRKLGRTGYEIPIIGMGIMNADNPELIHAACEAGVGYFNSSANYQYGRIEEQLGHAIARLKIRDKVVIATSDFDYSDLHGLPVAEVKRKVRGSCEASLRRLRTDYIDIFYVYEGNRYSDLNDPAVKEALVAMKDEGKIRYTGVTTHSGMAYVINNVVQGGFYDMVLTSINFTMADDTRLLQAISDAAQNDIGIVGMKVMAGGTRWPNPGSRSKYKSSVIAKACLKWVMRNENITTCVAGYMNFEHMNQDISVAYNLEYTEEEQQFIADNGIKLGMGFCRQCQQCLASCPEGVDVPTLMRTHMYAAQYGDFYKARATLDKIPAQASINNCVECSDCVAACANSVDIGRRLDELKTMYA